MSLFLGYVAVPVESPDTYCSISQMTLFHWPGQRNRIKKTTLMPSHGHFTKQVCDTISLGKYGLRHTFCGHNSK